jgi:hypothetical protein
MVCASESLTQTGSHGAHIGFRRNRWEGAFELNVASQSIQNNED